MTADSFQLLFSSPSVGNGFTGHFPLKKSSWLACELVGNFMWMLTKEQRKKGWFQLLLPCSRRKLSLNRSMLSGLYHGPVKLCCVLRCSMTLWSSWMAAGWLRGSNATCWSRSEQDGRRGPSASTRQVLSSIWILASGTWPFIMMGKMQSRCLLIP